MKRLIMWFGIWLVLMLAWAGFIDGLLLYLSQAGIVPGIGVFAIIFWVMMLFGLLLCMIITLMVERGRQAQRQREARRQRQAERMRRR